MTSMMKNIPPEQMQKMMEMSMKMKSGGGDPKDASAMLNDPEMMKAPKKPRHRSLSSPVASRESNPKWGTLKEDPARKLLLTSHTPTHDVQDTRQRDWFILACDSYILMIHEKVMLCLTITQGVYFL